MGVPFNAAPQYEREKIRVPHRAGTHYAYAKGTSGGTFAVRRVVVAFREFFAVALPFFAAADRGRTLLLLGGVIGAELGVVYVAVSVIQWNGRFFNALENRSWASVGDELIVFGFIAVGAIIVGMAQYFFGQRLQIRWRRFLTERYVGQWMAEGRHFRVRFVAPEVDNIHLRIGNDILLFVQRTHELGTGLLGSVVAFASFAYMLWGLSSSTPLPLFGYNFAFPGYLIFIALAYASAGTILAHILGWRLIRLNFLQQRYESDFRFALARVTDHAEPVALMRGEAVERAEIIRRFMALVGNWTMLVARQTRLTGFVAGYGHVSTVFPILVVTPAYLAGAITLGSLVQAHLAFQRVEGAFAFCISAYSKIAEWKAILDRLSQFETAMAAVDAATSAIAPIEASPNAADRLSLDHLVMAVPGGETMAAVPTLSLGPGERALVNGPSGSGKSSLMRTLVGLWPPRSGRLSRPEKGDILVLPQHAYFPLGTLKTALAYPKTAESLEDDAVREAMDAVGLAHLAPRLHEEAEWSTVLSGGEQQRAAIARAILHRPAVLLLDESVAALDDAEARELYRKLLSRLPRTIVLSVGRRAVLADSHTRSIDLVSCHPQPAKSAPPTADLSREEPQHAENELLDGQVAADGRYLPLRRAL